MRRITIIDCPKIVSKLKLFCQFNIDFFCYDAITRAAPVGHDSQTHCKKLNMQSYLTSTSAYC